MSNKSSKSPSGEAREQPNEHIREQGIEKQDIKNNSGVPKTNPKGKQENLQNRGYEEDQPKNPVRNNGLKKDQENMPAGEPEKNGE
jgi:hypothetical protein